MPNPPKFNPRGRNAKVGPMVLPADGRKGKPPPWPLDEQSDAEKRLWADLWATPQAVAWEALGYHRVVARYARYALAAEDLDKAAMPEARQLEDRLGLTPKALRLLLWTIEEAEEKPDGALVVVSDDRWRNAAAG